MIDQKVRFLFQISRPTNVPHKWFGARNEPLGVGFQMKLTQTCFLFIFGKNKQTPWCNLLKRFKMIASGFLPDFSLNQKPPWLGAVSFET